jgi:pimeloyl-ACP methyl ester carboxylesterase
MTAATQQVRFCTAPDGVRLAYATVGKGPPLVRVAHWMSNLEFDWQSPVWRPWLEELSRYNTLIRYDQRANGLSDREVADISLAAWVPDLESVVDAAGLARFVLLGASQGAAVAIAYAVKHPERVSRLILYGGFAQGRLERGRPEEAEEAQVQMQLMKLGWGRDDPAFRQFFSTQFIPDGTSEELSSFNELQRRSTSPENAVRILKAAWGADVLDLVPRIRVPTLVLHSRGDRRVPFESGRLIASLIPDARFVPLESRNHVLLGSDPAWPRFLAAIRSFLADGQEAGPASDAFAALTPREREVLELLARAASRTMRSPSVWASPPRRCATRSAPSWTSSACRAAPRRS